MQKTLFLLILLLCCHAVSADRVDGRWDAAIAAGRAYSEQADWTRFYGSDYSDLTRAMLAYQIFPWVDVGVALEYAHDRGKGQQSVNGKLAGVVTYELMPVSLLVQSRLQWFPNQWLVPTVAAGVDRVFYQIAIHHQAATRGDITGYHTSFGIKLLLDKIDAHTFGFLKDDYGVDHAYFFLQAIQRHAEEASTRSELGGRSYVAGFAFDF